MTQATKTRKPVEIKSAVVFRCYAKEDTNKERCLGYLVPSDQAGIDLYKVTFNYEAHRYECNCKCGKEHDHTVTCKHIRAVNSTVAARKEFHKQQETPAATPEPVETHRVARVRGAGGTAWYPEYLENGQWFRYPDLGTTHSVHFLDESPERARQWLANRRASVIEAGFDALDRARLAEWNRHNASDAYDVLAETKMLRSTVCGHLVKHDVSRSCGCDA